MMLKKDNCIDNLETSVAFKKTRSDLCITQSQLAKSIGVTTRTVQNWESGKTKIPKAALMVINAMLEDKNWL